MSEQEFRVGDVVQLKSGGPNMTIIQLYERRKDMCQCAWFDGASQITGNQVLAALKLVHRG